MAENINMPAELRQDLIARLRRIEGQAQGVQRMLEDGRDCTDIVHQLASIRAATRSASVTLIEQYVRARLHSAPTDRDSEGLHRVMADILAILTHAP